VSAYHFADFELDPARFELRRNGRSLKLERIPMELLILLVEKDGNIATRQEIVDRLWGKDVFVDTEHGINTAIRKIRQTLRDDPEKPRFVQTVTGKGYRFVAIRNGSQKETPEALDPPVAPQSMWGQPPRLSGGPEVSGRSLATTTTLEINATSKAKKTALTAALVLCVVATALTFIFRTRLFPPPQIHSLAVIPLANLSGDKSQDYFADGMTDELITALAKNRNLRVVSRTSAMQYKGAQRPVRDIARELGVDGILEGSIERSADRVHMTVQLIYAPTDSHIWAESYDRDSTHAVFIPTELSRTVAEQIKVATSPAKPARYINPEAHDAYLRGRYFWLSFDPRQSIVFFQKAIDLQPDYAAAWSGMADSYSFATLNGEIPPQPLLEKALAAAHKAVELDDSLPEAHNSMAATAFLSWNLTLADSESRRALELNPNFPEGHYLHYQILLVQNQRDAALAEAKLATQLDPFSRPWGLGNAYLNVRQYDAALNEFLLQVQARPTDGGIHLFLSQVYWLKGMYNESESELEKGDQLSGKSEEAAAFRRAFERGGEKAVERYGADQIKARARKIYISPLVIADAVSYTGNKDETLKYLEGAYREHTPPLMWIQTQPQYDFLHHDPRYLAIVRKMGLQPAN
jgi:TolB-like protein/DNA-binding winged helix-turn-helix (wHTH) protein